jgi:hypothetical protein
MWLILASHFIIGMLILDEVDLWMLLIGLLVQKELTLVKEAAATFEIAHCECLGSLNTHLSQDFDHCCAVLLLLWSILLIKARTEVLLLVNLALRGNINILHWQRSQQVIVSIDVLNILSISRWKLVQT